MPKKYIYPKLPSKYHFIIRFLGSGLANCLFVYARAIILGKKYSLEVINPSWVQFNIGPYLRREKDKRHYNGLFDSFGISHVKKNRLLLTQKYYPEDTDPDKISSGIIVVDGLKNYFTNLHGYSDLVRKHMLSIVNKEALNAYSAINKKYVGVHIRLGDYDADSRVSFQWYLDKMKFIHENTGGSIEFFVFSDGTEDELAEVLRFPNTKLAFFGSAIADILVLSKAQLIIASDSTFSAWGAYLGQVPLLFNKRHFEPVLDNPENECVESAENPELSSGFILNWIQKYDINRQHIHQ